MYAGIEKAIQVHSLNFDTYRYEWIYGRVDQIVKLNNPLRGIDEAHCRALVELPRSYKCHSAPNMMAAYILSAVDPEVASYAGAVHNIQGRKLLKDGYRMVMIDGRYLHCSVNMLRVEDGVGCTTDPLRIHFEFLFDGKATSPAQSLIARKIANISTTFGPREETFTVIM